MSVRRAYAAALLALVALAGRPAAQGVANGLPDADSFLQEVREALARSQQLAHRFAYKERRTDMHMNPFGRLGAGDVRLLQVYPSPNPKLTYRREIERNGHPVPEGLLAHQDREYRKRVAETQRRLAREDEDDRRRREAEELLARRRAQMMIDDVVSALQFEVDRREWRDGVSTVVITFEAKPGAKPLTREGRIARVFKGSAWVHEDSREVAYVEAVATDNVAFGGFIAKLYEGTHATLERREIEPGVWMPVLVKFDGRGRALFRKFDIDYLVEWFDYSRLPVGDPTT